MHDQMFTYFENMALKKTVPRKVRHLDAMNAIIKGGKPFRFKNTYVES